LKAARNVTHTPPVLYLRDARRLREDEHPWRLRFTGAGPALEFLRAQLRRGPHNAARQALARACPELPLSRMSEDEVLERLAALVARGRLAVVVPKRFVHFVPEHPEEEQALGSEPVAEREWMVVDAQHEDELPPAPIFDDDVIDEAPPMLAADDAAVDEPPPALVADDRHSGASPADGRGGKEGAGDGESAPSDEPDPTLQIDDGVIEDAMSALSFDDLVNDNHPPPP
jgi:hypothetical protein